MSDEVSQFLEQVERLRGQQIEEDEVRARELEEYLAAKRERQARREGEMPNIHPITLHENQRREKEEERKKSLLFSSSVPGMVAEAFWSYCPVRSIMERLLVHLKLLVMHHRPNEGKSSESKDATD